MMLMMITYTASIGLAHTYTKLFQEVFFRRQIDEELRVHEFQLQCRSNIRDSLYTLMDSN